MTVWQEIADRVWVRRYAFFDQTIGVVGGAAGLLVLDTRSSHRQGDELRADLRELPGAVRWVVNTHYHHDHSFGNAVFADTELWGHERCPARLLQHGEAMRAGMIEEIPEQAEEWREVVITPPRITFPDHATIDVGDRAVDLRYLGRGHTDTDIVVTVPSTGVLFAGDLLENGAAPYFGDGFPLDWPATLESLIPLCSGPVVPGHGDVADIDFAQRSLGEIRAIADLGREVAAGALTVDEAVARSPYGPNPSRPAIERAAAQARGELDAV
jgi:glyoxylase-like metal-dependent hydrolase (beta-lactamase superfamily II)